MKTFIGSSLTENYIDKSMPMITSLNESLNKSAGNVQGFIVTLGFDMPENYVKIFQNIRFVRKEFDDVLSLPDNYCLQHGDFLPLDFIEDDDVIVYVDVGDVIVQRLFNKEEWDAINGLKHYDVLATYNAGEFDNLKAEYERLTPTLPLEVMEAHMDFNARHFPCYNTGVLAATKKTWESISVKYAEHWDFVNNAFKHWAKQQWLLSFVLVRNMNVKVMPKYFHVHGKHGLPEWMGFDEILDRKQICFRHGLPDKPLVTCLYPVDSGTGYWRMKLWIREMKKKHIGKVIFNIQDFGQQIPLQNIQFSQIVYIHALADMKFFLEIQKFRHPASVWIYDVCDNMLKIAPENPSFEGSQTPEYELAMTTLIKNCDILVCSTEKLKEEYAKIRNKETVVVPDSIDATQWEKWYRLKMINRNTKKEYRDDYIRLGWHGGCSHMRDFEIVAEAIADVLRKYPNTKMQFVGWTPDEHFVNFKGLEDRLEFVEWDKPEVFGKNLIRIDIGLAPLRFGKDTEFNDAKSPIKWMEYSMLEIPCIASNAPTYQCIEDGVTGFLIENTKEAWVNKMSELVESEALRKKIGHAAKERVLAKHSLKVNLKNWEKILGV